MLLPPTFNNVPLVLENTVGKKMAVSNFLNAPLLSEIVQAYLCEQRINC